MTLVKKPKPRDYKDEYEKFQSSPKQIKKRIELNNINHEKGTYGNGDGLDVSHVNGGVKLEPESINRGREEKSRMKGSKRKLKEGGEVKATDRQKTSNLYQGTPQQVADRMKKNPSFAKGMGEHYGVQLDKKSNTGLSKRKAKNGGDVTDIVKGLENVKKQRADMSAMNAPPTKLERYGKPEPKQEVVSAGIPDWMSNIAMGGVGKGIQGLKYLAKSAGKKQLTKNMAKTFAKKNISSAVPLQGIEEGKVSENKKQGGKIMSTRKMNKGGKIKKYATGSYVRDEEVLTARQKADKFGEEYNENNNTVDKRVEELKKKNDPNYKKPGSTTAIEAAKQRDAKILAEQKNNENTGAAKYSSKDAEVGSLEYKKKKLKERQTNKKNKDTQLAENRRRFLQGQENLKKDSVKPKFVASKDDGSAEYEADLKQKKNTKNKIEVQPIVKELRDKKDNKDNKVTFKEGLRDFHGNLVENPDGTKVESKKKITFKDGLKDVHGKLIENPDGTKTDYYKKTYGDKKKKETRREMYDRKNWKYDDTIKGYNRDGSKIGTKPKKAVEEKLDPMGTSGETEKEYSSRLKKEKQEKLSAPVIKPLEIRKSKSKFKPEKVTKKKVKPASKADRYVAKMTEKGKMGKVRKSLKTRLSEKVSSLKEGFKKKPLDARGKRKKELSDDKAAYDLKMRKKYNLKMQDGGMLSGPSHKKGGIAANVGNQPIEMEGGEYVIKKSSAKKLGEDTLNYLNKTGKVPQFMAGGYSKKMYQDGGMLEAEALEMGGKLQDNRAGFTPVYEQGGKVTVSSEASAGDVAHTHTHSGYKAGE